MVSTPKYERSGGIGLFLSQVPFAKRKKSAPGATERSSQLRNRPSVAAGLSLTSPTEAAAEAPAASAASARSSAAFALRGALRNACGKRRPSGCVDIAH